MNKTALHWLEQEMSTLSANIYRHRGVGPYLENCDRWALYLEAYQKLYAVLTEPAIITLDNGGSRGTCKRRNWWTGDDG